MNTLDNICHSDVHMSSSTCPPTRIYKFINIHVILKITRKVTIKRMI